MVVIAMAAVVITVVPYPVDRPQKIAEIMSETGRGDEGHGSSQA